MGDLAAGTGGFIISTLKYLEKQKKTAKDEELFQQAVMGQEWKPFPYLLGVTNIMLHGIKDPEFFHMDSLGKNMSEYQEDGKLDTIDTPDALIDELGNFTVEETSEETLVCHYFHTREEAIEYLAGAGEDAILRGTTLEDVFVERIGRRLDQK